MHKLLNFIRTNYWFFVIILGLIYLGLAISYWHGEGYQERKASSTELSRVISTSEWFIEHGLVRSAGIKEYTHYPETPTYIVYFLTKVLGFSPLEHTLPFRLLTTIPLNLIALVCIAWLLRSSKWNFSLIIFLFIMVFQSGICLWSGNLEQEAYGLAIGLLGIPIGLYCGKKQNLFIPFFYGFVLTSFSYDYSLISFLTFTSSYILGQSQYKAHRMVKCFLFIILGSLTTLAIHFVQVIFYYHSPILAFNDLAGSALARANIMNSAAPTYAQSVLKSLPKNYSYWQSVIVPISHLPSASSHLFRIVFVLLTLCVLVLLFATKRPKEEKISFFVALGGLFLWPILFPNHAQIHNYHFIPRHCFIFYCFEVVLMAKILHCSSYKKVDLKVGTLNSTS
jgi:hypothetical protein